MGNKQTDFVKPRTENQKLLIQTINEKDFVVLDAPVGTGKSWIIVGMAAELLEKGRVEKIVFCRSSSHLIKEYGYHPGAWKEKSLVFFDQMVEYFIRFLGKAKFEKHWHDNVIEFTSASIIRGRNFSNTFMVLEEAQMSSKDDIILFLSRMDKGSKVVLVGDRLQNGGDSGFYGRLVDNLEDDNVGRVIMTEEDIQRHKAMYAICKKIREI